MTHFKRKLIDGTAVSLIEDMFKAEWGLRKINYNLRLLGYNSTQPRVSAILCAKGMRSCVADVNVGSAGPFVRRLLEGARL